MPLPRSASTNDTCVPTRLPPAPFSSTRPVCPLTADQFESSLDQAGIRLMPYPFDSAFAVASDADGSTRERFTGYTRMLVHDLGLDFGDSAWIHWRYVFNANGTVVATNSSGFLSPSLTEQTTDGPQIFKRNRNFLEILSEYHEGNVDHFHSLLPHGPRFAVLQTISREGDSIAVDIPPIDASCNDFHVFGICFVFSGRSEPEIQSVHVESNGEIVDYQLAEHDHPADGNSYFLFLRDVDPESSESVPHLRNVSRIVAQISGAHGALPARVILVSTYGRLLLDRLNFLREKYNVEMPLATEHSMLHFRNPRATDVLQERNARQYEAQAESLCAFNGPLVDSSGKLIASVDSDEPHSFARVFPEVVDEAELRFIVPIPASKAAGLHMTELLAQSPTRSGGGVYWAKRVQPNVTTPEPGKTFDGRTRHDTFVARVQRAIEDATDVPGGFWPIYTHLGGLALLDGKRIELPDPYFEPGPLLDLQDRVFGITANVPEKSRIWFARASTLYDYALILQGVVEHMERSDSGSISLRSWDDPILGKKLPRAPSQLYGLTFYVDDEASGNVTLDDVAIEHLTRNPPDSSGSPSITIAECDISTTLFRGLDPRTMPGATLEAGEWTWRDGQSPHGRLLVSSEGTAAKLRVPMHGMMLPGAQLLGFRLRAEAGCACGVLLETCSGGRFWFGSSSLADEIGEINATYAIDRLLTDDEWVRVVVPFHDLKWADDARPGGPLPSHALEAVTLICSGSTGAAAEFGDMRLLRPRVSTAAREPDRGHCVVGVIPGASQGEIVRLCPLGNPQNARITHTDQLGWFSFTNVAPGLYDVVGSKGDAKCQSARGATVEVWSDVPRLELTHPIGGPEA